MKIKYLFLFLFFLNTVLYSCSNINFDSLTFINKSGLDSCSDYHNDDINDIAAEIASINVTFKKLLTVMTDENNNIGKQILELNAKVKGLRKIIVESDNLFSQKNKVIKKSKDIKAELNKLKDQIRMSSDNLVDAQNKMTDVFCIIRKRYEFYEAKEQAAEDPNTKILFENTLTNLSSHCNDMYDLLVYINTFFESFKVLENDIAKSDNHVFAIASSVVTFVSNANVCNADGCIYTEKIKLDVLLDLIGAYHKNSKTLVDINSNKKLIKD